MVTFDLEKYAKENDNTKVKVFIEYLLEKFEIDLNKEKFDNEYFLLLNEEDLIESLEFYIYKNNVKSQGTAKNYITYITDFFDELSSVYKIRNDVFTDIDNRRRFLNKSKEIISRLKLEKESKDIATEEQFLELNDYIKKYLSEFSESDIYDEMNKETHGKKKYIRYYNRFVSIISTKLVMKYALKNLTAIMLDMKDLDIENKTITINDITLPLDEELVWLFNIYLKIRKYAIELSGKKENLLFIQYNGEPYISYPEKRRGADYEKFFLIMGDSIKTFSAELFSNRRIVEMLDYGIDISTVAKLSERSIEKCIELQKNHCGNNEDKLFQFLNENANNTKKVIIKKKAQNKTMICQFCGREVKVTSDAWVLVQFSENDIKYLACRECKGENGKHNI